MILADAEALSSLLHVLENTLVIGSIYGLIAIGYTLVYGIIELINFAHGDVFMWGTVIVYFVLVVVLKIGGPLDNPFAMVGLMLGLMVVCMLVCALLAVILERVAYRPLRRAPRLAPLISAIGASFVLENLALFYLGPSNQTVPNIFPTLNVGLLGVQFDFLDLITIVLSMVLVVAVATFINRTKLGRAMRSVAQDREAAALMGVDINRIIVLTFIVGGALAGVVSVVYAMKLHSAFFLTGFGVGLKAFTAAVVGGIGNLYGAMLGGLFIGLVESVTIQYIPKGQGINWADAAVFAVLALVLVFRPSGLLGQPSVEKV